MKPTAGANSRIKQTGRTGAIRNNEPRSIYKTDNKDWTEWSDAAFLEFMERHSQTKGALFNVKMITRLVRLADADVERETVDKDAHLPLRYERAKPLIDAARKRLGIDT